MTAPVTFADALAALTAACGEPTWTGGVCAIGLRAAVWSTPDRAGGVSLREVGDTVRVEATHPRCAAAGPWTLAGDAPLTPLPDAVAAAVGWLRARGGQC